MGDIFNCYSSLLVDVGKYTIALVMMSGVLKGCKGKKPKEIVKVLIEGSVSYGGLIALTKVL